jgi:hypothetical protein
MQTAAALTISRHNFVGVAAFCFILRFTIP